MNPAAAEIMLRILIRAARLPTPNSDFAFLSGGSALPIACAPTVSRRRYRSRLPGLGIENDYRAGPSPHLCTISSGLVLGPDTGGVAADDEFVAILRDSAKELGQFAQAPTG